MVYRIIYWTGLVSCILLIVACFLPWVHINSINETLSGMNVKPFRTGNNYGNPGKVIIGLTTMILLFMIIPRIWTKRINLFLAAVMLAFVIRSYMIFSGSLFEGDVITKPGLYLTVLCSLLIFFASIFTKIDVRSNLADESTLVKK